jgi:hypothetical protein
VGASIVSSVCYTLIFFFVLAIVRRSNPERVADVSAATVISA